MNEAPNFANAAATESPQALVIGAGPAGAVAATLLAAAGLRTLLVEAKQFPREKVCGGCLSQRAVAGLEGAGFGDALARCGGVVTHGVHLHLGGSSLYVPTPPGLAVTRRSLDEALVEAAAARGVQTRFGVRATVLPSATSGRRRVQLVDEAGASSVVDAEVVIAADGLGSPSLARLPEFQSVVEPQSHLGIGAVIETDCGRNVDPGQVQMAIGEQGYLGFVLCENGRLNLAGAFAPGAFRQRDEIPGLVERTLEEAGVEPPPDIASALWRGTPRLTRSTTLLASERLFVVGDSGGYVEPFTGEGMAAAIEDAIAVAPFALRAATAWRDSLAEEWQARQSMIKRSRQRDCRRLAWLLRQRWAARLALRLSAAWPQLSQRIAQRVSGARNTNRRGLA